MVFLKKLKINTWSTIIITLQLGTCNKINKILISRIVHCQKNYLVYLIILISIWSSFFRKLEFHSNNWFDSLMNTGLIKFKSTIHITSICNSNSWLSELLSSFGKTPWISECLLKCIMRMCMKMDERHISEYMKNDDNFKRKSQNLLF